MEKITNPGVIKDLTGFELFLLNKGWNMLASATYFNTYTGCSRHWSDPKSNKCITVGLMSTPCRIGITHPFRIGTKENPLHYTYLPSEEQYEEWFNKLTLKINPGE